tara:strand:- start:103 stop:513 length:411 start_codon:yes stop_codon:yes gene_type:complete
MINIFDVSISTEWTVRFLITSFFAVLFLQSGLDKFIDWNGNKAYFTAHFNKSPLSKVVVPMLFVISLLEIIAGLTSTYGLLAFCLWGETEWAKLGIILAAVNLLILFSGQRINKDYGGAAVLVSYLLIAIVGLLLF